MKEKILYLVKRSKGFIYILGFVLSVIGSIQLFHGQFDSVIKEIEVVSYSVVKLFLFSPMKDITQEIPLIYNLAIWIAPIGTVLGFISLFENVYNQFYDFFVHNHKKHTIIIGFNPDALTYLRNVQDGTKFALLSALPVSDVQIKMLKKLNTIVCMVNFDDPKHLGNQQVIKQYKLNQANRIMSFESEPMSYTVLNSLSKMLEPESVMNVYFMTQSQKMKDLMVNHIDHLKMFDVHYFNLEDLLAQQLLFNQSFMVHQTPAFSESWNDKDLSSFESLCDIIGNPSLLMIGFDTLGQRLLMQVANQATINPLGRLQVTLVDHKVEERFEAFDGSIEHLEMVMDVNRLKLDIHSRDMGLMLESYLNKNPQSTIIYTLKDTSESLLNLQRFVRILRNARIAIYCPESSDVSVMLSAIEQMGLKISLFGEKRKVLNNDVIINETYYQKAKEFNAYYNRVAADLMGWSQSELSLEEQWKKLSTLKKESSLYQTNHQVVKRDLLKKICEHPSYPKTISELLQMFNQRLANKSVSEQVNIIEADPMMNFLCALEHKRWDNFYFMRDFSYGSETNEALKLHNCLIDSWQEFMSSEMRDKAIYDFLSVLSVSDEA